ncbi:MAG: nitroreductase family protein [Acetobacterium sp.]
MKFREFTVNSHSTRDFLETGLEERDITDIKNYLNEVNIAIGKEKGFSFVFIENGFNVYKELEGSGGYSGLMIKSPHYIGLRIEKTDHEIEFYGAFYMQSIIKKLYELNIGSCWITLQSLPLDKIQKLMNGQPGTIQYLLAIGQAQEKPKPNKAILNRTSKYDQDPYGLAIINTEATRLSVVDTVYLHEFGKVASFADMKSRSVLDLLYYVRNSPSYQNSQPCRLILKDGYMELAIINPENERNYTDAGIMMYILQGLAKELGFPSKWHFINDESDNKEYKLVAHFDL